jgi:hypothetical protein
MFFLNMPAAAPMPQPGLNWPDGWSPQIQQNSATPNGDQSTNSHVVGSQGWRKILPNSPGRLAAPAAGSGQAKITQQDADEQFPCPDCTKIYQRKGNLKRHLWRRKPLPYLFLSLSGRCLTVFCRHRRTALHV